jgi:hypothetical protein
MRWTRPAPVENGSTGELLLQLAVRLQPAAKLLLGVSVAGLVGLVYVLGAYAMALRLRGAGFPAEEGLRAISRETLVFLGTREFLFVLLPLLGVIWLRRYLPWLAAALLLVVPLTFAGLAWPLALLLLYAIWRLSGVHGFDRLVVSSLLVVPILVPLRYADPPYRIPAVVVYTKTGCRHQELSLNEGQGCLGGLISSGSDGVYVGAPSGAANRPEPRIVLIPQSEIVDLVITRHFPVAPRTSLLGRLTRWIGIAGVSCNPLECWVGKRNYGVRIIG